MREEGLALRVTTDRPGETEIGQVLEGRTVDHLLVLEEAQPGVVEGEIFQFLEEASGASQHPVPSTGRQTTRERLEDATPFVHAGANGGLQHREFVVVRQECGGV